MEHPLPWALILTPSRQRYSECFTKRTFRRGTLWLWSTGQSTRFPKSVVASGVWAASQCDQSLSGSDFLLHIEQGPILESEKAKIGVVQGAQAYRWFTLDIEGRPSHTGTTPFKNRSDALLCAAQIMVASADIGKKHGGLSSTFIKGILKISPGSTNTTPGHVSMTIDMRHRSVLQLDKIETELRTESESIATTKCEKGCSVKWTKDYESRAVSFDEGCISAVCSAAIDTVGEEKVRDMYSGAGHDSCATSIRCPTSMIFVPSRDGLSHNPLEYTSPEDCALGAQVLLNTVLRYDSMRH
ncbi:Gly-Xaa carboxypeptidase [Ceratobasidium sp. AG-Ba]|nr:Gly-Xaa carboxypeptidase [Ceratobasidium sp. AG-Ba]